MKSQIFSIDFLIASFLIVIVIIAILNISFSNNFYNREAIDISVALDDKGVFWEDEKTINNSLNGASAMVRCYKYTGTWDLEDQKIVTNGNPKFWYRSLRVNDNKFCVIDVGV